MAKDTQQHHKGTVTESDGPQYGAHMHTRTHTLWCTQPRTESYQLPEWLPAIQIKQLWVISGDVPIPFLLQSWYRFFGYQPIHSTEQIPLWFIHVSSMALLSPMLHKTMWTLDSGIFHLNSISSIFPAINVPVWDPSLKWSEVKYSWHVIKCSC